MCVRRLSLRTFSVINFPRKLRSRRQRPRETRTSSVRSDSSCCVAGRHATAAFLRVLPRLSERGCEELRRHAIRSIPRPLRYSMARRDAAILLHICHSTRDPGRESDPRSGDRHFRDEASPCSEREAYVFGVSVSKVNGSVNLLRENNPLFELESAVSCLGRKVGHDESIVTLNFTVSHSIN